MASLASRISNSLPSRLAMSSLPVCSSPACLRPPTLWQRWWARHEGIHLEEDWYCSPQCFAAGLNSRVSALSRAPRPVRASGQRFPLGLILLEQGAISQSALQDALHRQRQAGEGRIGEWLIRIGAATEADVASALAVQQNCPLLSGSVMQSFSDRLRFPKLLTLSYDGVPVHFSPVSNCLYLGFTGRVNRPLLSAAAHLVRCRVEPCIVSVETHRAALASWEDSQQGEAIFIQQSQPAREVTRTIASYAEQANASGCALARCEDHLWVRLYGDIASLDLLFSVPTAEG